MSPESCAEQAWGVFYTLMDAGYSDEYAYAGAQGVYDYCIDNENKNKKPITTIQP